jgi:ferredoxin--NADP+ reductase
MTDQALLAHTPPPSVQTVHIESVRHYGDRLFAFTCERPAALRFRSGEFVMLGLMVEGRPLLRAYSIASPAWDDSLTFYSIKAPNGPLTRRLQKIAPGDEILLGRKPTGTLVLDALARGRRLFLISTGTGVAPFASLVREPETYARFEEVILTQTCRTDGELEFGREAVKDALADPLVGEAARAKLRHITTLTRKQHQLTGRITSLIENRALFAALKSPPFDPQTDRLMFCGSVAMSHDVKAIALKAGFKEGSNQEPGSFVIERAFAGGGQI